MGRIGRLIPALVLFIAILAVWYFAVQMALVNPLILPDPVTVVVALGKLVGSGIIWPSLGATLYEVFAGFLIGSMAGVIIAILCGLSVLLRQALTPFAVALQVTPLIAVAPLIVAWLGFGYSSKIAIAALICFFPTFVNTLAGVMSTPAAELEMFRSLGARNFTVFRKLMLPHALPQIFAGLKTSMTLALIGAIVGEFIAGQDGLGILVKRFSSRFAIPEAFAIVLVLSLLGLLLYALISLLERWIVFWAHDSRLSARSLKRKTRYTERTINTNVVVAPLHASDRGDTLQKDRKETTS